MSQDKNNSILSQLNPQIDIGYVMLTSANEEIKTNSLLPPPGYKVNV